MGSDKKTKRLQELKGSDFEITDGQPDIRGWEIIDPQGRKIGKVSELIFDSRARRVRYMIANVINNKELQLEERKVMVPIGLAELDQVDDVVVLHTVTPFQLRALPKYDKEELGAKTERSISTVFGRTHTATASDAADAEVDTRFYEDDLFNENNMYKKRRNTSTVPTANDRYAAGMGADNINESYRENKNNEKDLLRTEKDVNDLENDLDAADRRDEANEAFKNRSDDTTRPIVNSNRDLDEREIRNRDIDEREIRNRNIDEDDWNKNRPETNEEYIRRARRNIDNR